MRPRTDVLDPSFDVSDPAELIELKRKLTLVSCTCPLCEQFKSSTAEFLLTSRNKHVQVQPSKVILYHKHTQANPEGIKKDKEGFFKSVTRDVLCPSCFATMNILRGGAIRILKDEESEINPRTFRDDKGVEVRVVFDDKSTSFLEKSSLELSNIALHDIIDEQNQQGLPKPALTPEKRHQVKFMRYNIKSEVDTNAVKQELDRRFGHCVCLENFMDSIRPPLDRELVFR